MTLTPFHLAIPVHDIQVANHFYGEVLALPRGRSSDRWTDFNLFGHQLVCHETGEKRAVISNPVDGHEVPVPHFGVVLSMEHWATFRDRLADAGIEFAIAPYIRFAGLPGEQATMFLTDPSGNALEFKSFKDPTQLFAS